MSRYFDWTASLKRFVRFDTARSEDVNDALDELTAGLDDLDLDVNRSIKLPSGTADQTLALGAGARANKVLAFDGSGNITVSTNDVDSSAASAAAAAASASSASTSASTASTGASTATTQAGIATTKASEASASASSASTSASTATTQAGIATTQAGIATTQAGIATTKASEASTSAGTASTAATTATTKAGEALTSASNAAASESSAATSASTATTKASEANASAIAAAASAASIDPATIAAKTTGPASTTDNTIARFDGGTGKLLQSSSATLDDTGGFAGVSSINGGQLAGLRNKIINGKMEIAQRGTSFAAIAPSAYSLDRWQFGNTSAAVGGLDMATGAGNVPSTNEFQSSLRYTVSTADASIAAGDVTWLQHKIEGYNARDLIGKTFTLSFWVRSSKTGIHCIALQNAAPDRCFVYEYTVNAANTWEQKTITVSGGLITAGTWDWTTGKGLHLCFVLACGSTFQTTASAWQTGAFYATANQVNCLDTIGNIFAITGVQLEVGSVATPFEHRPYGVELALCQRYYYRVIPGSGARYGSGHAATTTTAQVRIEFPVVMRSNPTTLEVTGTSGDYGVVYQNTTGASTAVPTFSIASTSGAVAIFTLSAVLTVGNGISGYSTNTTSFLGFSAEL